MEFNSGDKINKTNNNCYYCLTPCTIFSRHKIILLLYSAQFQKCISTKNHSAFNPFRTREDQKKYDDRNGLFLVYAVPDFNITNIVITLCLQKVVLVVGARCVMSFIYGFYGPVKHIPLMSNRL